MYIIKIYVSCVPKVLKIFKRIKAVFNAKSLYYKI